MIGKLCIVIFNGGVYYGKYNNIFTYSIGNYVLEWHCYGNTCAIFQYQEETSNIFNHIFDYTNTADLYSDTVHCWFYDFTIYVDNCIDI